MSRSTVENLEVVFEDNHLIAVNKKPSDIVQGDKTNDIPLSEIVKLWIKKKYNKPGQVYLGVIHRIDRPVSGVVVFAKTSKAHARMSELFRSKKIQKIYWAAVCASPPKTHGTLKDFLVKDGTKNKSRVTGNNTPNAKESVLEYALVGKSDKFFFLEISPKTGRHHQIRVQLANMGCMIKGDLKYGARRSNKDASIHLHARSIEFIHPVKKENLKILASSPDDPVWNTFPNESRGHY